MDWSRGWQYRAECRGEDSALFFAPSYFEKRGAKLAREARAKLLCHACPVMLECRDYSLRTREEHGVWGGLNEAERRRVLRMRDRVAATAGEMERTATG